MQSYYKQIYPTFIKTSQGLGATGVFEAWKGQVAIIINNESTNWQNKGIRLECMGSIVWGIFGLGGPFCWEHLLYLVFVLHGVYVEIDIA